MSALPSPLEVCVRRPPVRAAPPSWGRHPQTFTGHEIAARSISARGTAGAHFPRFRALALFGRRPPHRVDSLVMPASENLHMKRLMHRSKR